jgi:hypothetical protein
VVAVVSALAVKPGHFKATVLASGQATVLYACLKHESDLRDCVEDRAPVLDTTPAERDSAGVWCSFCSEQAQGAK